MKARARDKGLDVISVGTNAMVGQPADESAIEVMRQHGYDITAHRAQQATSPLLQWADLILAMDQTHIEWVIMRLPQLRGRVFRIGKWRNEMDIVDPYKQPLSAFVDVYENISDAVDDWIVRL